MTAIRPMAVRLKKTKGKTTTQQKWLTRQLNDPFVARARAEGYRSRAAYKLIEIDDREKLLRQGARIVDLGAAPGGWLQVASQRIGLNTGKGKIIGIDLIDIEPITNVSFMHYDFTLEDAPDKLKALLGGEADIVLSDLAANTTGHRPTDHIKIIALAELAYQFAIEVLAEGGHFCCKVLQGGTENQLLKTMKADFKLVKHIKPAASRKDSAETYLLAKGFRKRKDVLQETPLETDSTLS